MSSPVVNNRPWGGFAWVTLAYVVAIAVAGLTLRFLPTDWHVMSRMAVADLAATIVVFVFSRGLNNSSLYDAYWSVAPMVIAIWLALGPGRGRGLDARQALVLSLVSLYGIRLTYNWARGWTGLGHEDWRYVQMREANPRAYWLISFSALHLFPTLMVLLGVLPLYAALVTGSDGLNGLDLFAAVITLGAVTLEGVADNQLRAFRADPKNEKRICDVGVWAYSRHPNYFGEISFWCCLFLFGVAAGSPAWMAAGPAVMIGLFVGASIPMSEKRSLLRRPAYAEHQRKVSMLVPWFPKKDEGDSTPVAD